MTKLYKICPHFGKTYWEMCAELSEAVAGDFIDAHCNACVFEVKDICERSGDDMFALIASYREMERLLRKLLDAFPYEVEDKIDNALRDEVKAFLGDDNVA